MKLDDIIKIISICKSLQDKGYDITHCDNRAIVFTKDTILKKHCIGFDLENHEIGHLGYYPNEEIKKIFDEFSKLLHDALEKEISQ